MTTTRNPDWDALSTGQSLSAIGKDLDKTKLMFGGHRMETVAKDAEDKTMRAAFGLEGKVKGLRKGERYI
jgi:hypothetical protein